MKIRIRPSLFIFIVLLLLVLSLWVLINKEYITVDNKISVGAILSSFLAILTAVFVSIYIERHLATKNKEKQLLLDQIDLMIKYINEFEDSKDQRQITIISSMFKKLNIANNTVCDIASEINLPKQVQDNLNFDDHISPLKRLATNTPHQDIHEAMQNSNVDIEVQDNVVKLSLDREALIDSKIALFRKDLINGKLIIYNC